MDICYSPPDMVCPYVNELGLVRINGLWDVEVHCMGSPTTCFMLVNCF